MHTWFNEGFIRPVNSCFFFDYMLDLANNLAILFLRIHI